MEVRDILRNSLAVLIIAGAMAFATAQFIKSRQTLSNEIIHGNWLQQQALMIKQKRIHNSILEIRARALEKDPKANSKLVRDRFGLMRMDEVRVSPEEL